MELYEKNYLLVIESNKWVNKENIVCGNKGKQKFSAGNGKQQMDKENVRGIK